MSAVTPPTPPAWYLKIPPPVWGIVLLLAAGGLDRVHDWGMIVRLPMVGVFLAVLGVALAVWGRMTFAAEGTEVIPTSTQNKKLVTRGPFAFTRNPMYLGLVLVTLGIALYAGTIPFFLVPAILFLFCNTAFIPFEEAKMRRQFGGQYTDYTRRVRRWL
jgi:protein-S-isoprenylcysteine O-methyltransferase Ste14